MAFGPNTVIQPTPVPSREPPSAVDDPFGDFTSGEIQAMNREFIEDQRLQEAGHND